MLIGALSAGLRRKSAHISRRRADEHFVAYRIPVEIALWIFTPFLTLAVLEGLYLLVKPKR